MISKLHSYAEALEAASSIEELRDAVVNSARALIAVSGVSFLPYEPGVPFGTHAAFSHDEFSEPIMRAQTLAMFPITERDTGGLPAIFRSGALTVDLNARFGAEGFERTETYNDYWRPYKIERQLLAVLGSPGSPLGYICISRRKNEAPFRASDLARLEWLRSQVQKPLRRLLGRDTCGHAVANVLAAGLETSAALFDAGGRLLWATDIAKKELGLSSDQIQPADVSPRVVEWRTVALHVIASRTQSYEGDGLLVRRVEVEPGVPAALVTRTRGGDTMEERVAGVSRRRGLTKREEEITLLLAGGRANKDIAVALFCSVRTVEVHVSSILRKVQCGSRAELIARLGQ